MIRALSWNLYHGRDFPPDRSLRTWRSRILRIEERNATHRQVNRDLFDEFATVLCDADWDVALLQECPPRWIQALAARCDADAHVSLTSRNSLPWLRSTLARLNPDLIASGEGGSNVILARDTQIRARDERVLATRPERRTMALARLATGIAVANLHASNAPPDVTGPQVLSAAQDAIRWAGDAPLLFGGDLNLRPDRAAAVFAELRDRHGLCCATAPTAIDHLLARGLEIAEPPHAWLPEEREVADRGLAIRLSDHPPVEAVFTPPPAA